MTVILDGRSLTAEEVVRVARERERVELAPAALERMRQARAVVEAAIERGEVIYGISTGVGAKKNARVEDTDGEQRERLLVLNHRVGQGPAYPAEVARAAALRLLNHLVSARTAARPELAATVAAALRDGRALHVRSLGSVGQADLSSNADLTHALLPDFALASGEGIALLNHNAISTGHAALALTDAAKLVDALDVAGALDLEAFGANLGALDPAVASERPYAGLGVSLERVRRALDGSALWADGAARNLQDPLSFRCLPHLNGAARDGLGHARSQLAVELNASQSNPLVILDERGGRVVSQGSFDVFPLASALDFVRIALVPALTSAAERAVKLLQRPLSGLPEGLAARPGLHEDGLAEFGIAAQALAAEGRLLAQPVSFELASTTQAEGIEDRTTMAPLAARRLSELVRLGAGIVAIELVIAAQAVDLRGLAPLGQGTAFARAAVRQLVDFQAEGEPIPQDLEPLVALVAIGALEQ